MLVPVSWRLFLKQDLSQRIKSLECIRYVTITYKSISNVCLSTPWKRQGATFLGGSKLCISFFFKTSCCIYIRLSAGQKPHTENYPWSYRDCLSPTLPGFPSFLSARERWVCTSWWVARQPPDSSLAHRPRRPGAQSGTCPWASVRNRQPTLSRMEEQMSLKLIFGHRN